MYVKASNSYNRKNLSGHVNIDIENSPYSKDYVEKEFMTKHACTRDEYAQRILYQLVEAKKIYKRKSKIESEDIFTFGKYKDQKCSDVRDMDYIAWLYFHCRDKSDVVKLIVENYDCNSVASYLFRKKI